MTNEDEQKNDGSKLAQFIRSLAKDGIIYLRCEKKGDRNKEDGNEARDAYADRDG